MKTIDAFLIERNKVQDFFKHVKYVDSLNFLSRKVVLRILAITLFKSYIICNLSSAQCTQDCNMVGNGEFENSNMNCDSEMNNSIIDCWQRLNSTPDYFGRDCMFLNMGIPTSITYTDIPADTWNNDNVNNNHFIGLYGRQYWGYNNGVWEQTVDGDEEAVQTTLASPIQSGHTYELSFYAMIGDGVGYVPFEAYVAICGANMELPYNPSNNFEPTDYVQFGNHAIVSNEFWTEIVHQFSYTGTEDLTQLILAYDASANPNYIIPEGGQNTHVCYVMIDNVRMREIDTNESFELPRL